MIKLHHFCFCIFQSKWKSIYLWTELFWKQHTQHYNHQFSLDGQHVIPNYVFDLQNNKHLINTIFHLYWFCRVTFEFVIMWDSARSFSLINPNVFKKLFLYSTFVILPLLPEQYHNHRKYITNRVSLTLLCSQ